MSSPFKLSGRLAVRIDHLRLAGERNTRLDVARTGLTVNWRESFFMMHLRIATRVAPRFARSQKSAIVTV
jgi:hypothetical protein